MKNFALVGASGYIAPRHMQAIKETGNSLVAALDPNDSVGIIDSYFPQAAFFTEYERFDRHVDKARRSNGGGQVDYVSICSPNYLHDSHMRFAMRSGADAICEKPIVLNPWNLDALEEIEQVTGQRVHSILQLRVHPAVISLKSKIENDNLKKKHDVKLTYVTSRGLWYLQSWKGDERKSGGIATNIGVHFFDLLSHLFGKVLVSEIYLSAATKVGGAIEYENAVVKWFLSIDINDVPEEIRATGQRTFRSITVDEEEVELSSGFADLHTMCYKEILEGRGFGLSCNRSAIKTVSEIRRGRVIVPPQDAHPAILRNARG